MNKTFIITFFKSYDPTYRIIERINRKDKSEATNYAVGRCIATDANLFEVKEFKSGTLTDAWDADWDED